MRKTLALLLVLLLMPTFVSANPFGKLKKEVVEHRRFFIMEATNAGGVLVYQFGMRHCRRGYVERCPEGYGDANAWFWVISSYSMVVAPAIAEACWYHSDDWKGCYPIGYSGAAYQYPEGIHYLVKNNPPEAEHEALKHVELVKN